MQDFYLVEGLDLHSGPTYQLQEVDGINITCVQ